MTTVNDVISFLGKLAPEYMKEEWDNVGLLCGSPSTPVTKILVALDPFEHVCRETAEVGAQLLVTHHPLIFTPLTSVTDETSIGRSVMVLNKHGISALCAHTNLDCAPGGVNDVLATALGLSDMTIIDPSGTDERGKSYGLLRCGYVEESTLESFMAQVKANLGTPTLRFVRGNSTVHKVAVGGGACAGAIPVVKAAGCDTFVTADAKYNQFWDAKEAGLNLIDAGHFYTENPVVAVLAAELSRAFPEIEVIISRTHHDCMEFA